MNRLALILIALFFAGCMTHITPQNAGQMVTIDEALPAMGTETKANVGDVFFDYTKINGQDNGFGTLFGTNFRFALTITALNEKEIALQYEEYMKQTLGAYGGFYKDAPWLIKQGFNKTFTYSPKETIRFKGYEFEPISVSNGQITYKRVK